LAGVIITLQKVMPSQRKKGLKLAGAYVSEKTWKALRDEAKRQGVTVADLIRAEIAKLVPSDENRSRPD
jgi:hypothetical protein